MSFFSTVASGVSGFIRGGSSSVLSSTAPEDQTATIEEVVTQTESVTIEEPMEVDGVTNGDVPSEQTDQPTAGPSNTQTTVRPDTPPRASSVPLGQEVARMPRFGYVYDVRMMHHTPVFDDLDHPEQPARISGIYRKLRDGGCLKHMKLIPIRSVRKSEVILVHSEDHWSKVQQIAYMSIEQMTMSRAYYEHLSLYVNPNTTLAALLSCGGVIEASLAVARGELERSFAIVRPPGHHAEPEEHMGFCFFNNVAVATRVVQQITPLKHIMILDWDVHHGNGTQRAFNDDPNVLYVSIHRYDNGSFYPGGSFGGMDSCGEGVGEGTSVNIPWPEEGMGDAEYLHAFLKVVMPIAMEFAPELVIISAGFDAAVRDELGECLVTPEGYAHMTHMLMTLAGGKVVVALEGGYNVDSISNSALAVTRVLLGESPPEMRKLVANEAGSETVWQVAKHQSTYWKNLDANACEPREEFPEQTISIPELLKMHREEHLFRTYMMVQVPLLDPEVDARFQAQVICSQDVMDKDTLVLLIHQFGNLRVELTGAATCDVQLEYSYLLDITKNLVDWVVGKQFSYVEVNTYPRPKLPDGPNYKRSRSELAREVVTYLWDNYIQLSNAKNVILIGHGPGCAAAMELLSSRGKSAMKKIKAVALVVGQEDIPASPDTIDELRTWYIKNSFVAAPENHPLAVEGRVRKKHGKVTYYDEKKTVHLMTRALPDIQAFIESKLV